MSEQNQWPKPGETTPNDASADQQAPSSAAQPDPGQPQQYGASAPEAPAPAPSDPWGQQNPYAAPGQGQQNPYAAPQNPYAAPSQGQPNPYAPQNPYAAQGQGQPGGQPGYGAPQNPYAAPGQQNPYAAPPAYASSGYQPYAQRAKVNTLSVLAIVFGLAGALPFFWFIGILLGPTGAILGHIALGKLKTNGERGRGLALTGVIAGWIITGIWILVVLILVATGIGSARYSDDYSFDSGAFIG